MQQLDELVHLVLEKAADAALFPELVSKISQIETADALVVWLKALSKNPDLSLARLQLAKLLWELDCVPFALEQLILIEKTNKGSGNEALKKLIQRLGGTLSDSSASTAEPVQSKTLASVDFDIEVLDPDK